MQKNARKRVTFEITRRKFARNSIEYDNEKWSCIRLCIYRARIDEMMLRFRRYTCKYHIFAR